MTDDQKMVYGILRSHLELLEGPCPFEPRFLDDKEVKALTPEQIRQPLNLN